MGGRALGEGEASVFTLGNRFIIIQGSFSSTIWLDLKAAIG